MNWLSNLVPLACTEAITRLRAVLLIRSIFCEYYSLLTLLADMKIIVYMAGKHVSIEKIVGERIRARREALNLSQEQLAFECGLHRTYISQIERGMKSPTVRVLLSLATALGTSPDELLRELPNAPHK